MSRVLAIAALLSAAACSEAPSSAPHEDAAMHDAAMHDAEIVDATIHDSSIDDSAIMPSVGCDASGDALYAPGTSSGQLMQAGVARSFRVHAPPGYDGARALPVVLMLHGGGGSARQLQEASAGMDEVADREGFITVYPDGTGALRTWNGGGCCGAAVTSDVDDVGFIAALLDHLEASLCVDRRRVFASGMSNGAILSHRLACELGDRIAAIAPVAGTDMTASCEPARAVSVMQIHGSDDGHVPWDGGQGCGPARVAFTSVPETLERWRTRNACSASTRTTFEEGDGRCEAFDGCADGSDVVLCRIEGGGHSWPGGAPPAGLVECPGNGGQSTTFHASEAIWAFFAAHRR